MAERIRIHDWSATPLGPVRSWSERLKVLVELMLTSPLVSTLACGPQRLLIYNDAAARHFGDRHPTALGHPLPDTFPDGWATVAPFYARAFAGETVQVCGEPLDTRGKGAATDVFDALLAPVRESDGSVAFVHMTGVEVSGRAKVEVALRESDERQAFLLKLSDVLRPLADPAQIQDAATRVLGKHLRANRVAYVQVTEDEYIIEQDYVDGVPSMAGRFRVNSFGTDKVADYQEGRTRVVRDTEKDARNDPVATSNFAAFGVAAGIGVPLIKGERFVATLVVHTSEPRDWSPGEVVLAEETAERTWAAMERARAEAALRESEARLAAAFESVPVGVAVIDMDGTIEVANGQYRRFLPGGVIPSRDPARLARWRAWDAEGRPIEPQDFPGARAIRGERVIPGQEMLFTDGDGREIWTRVTSVPIRDTAGRVTAQASVISDIDALKRGADALRASERRQRALIEGMPQLVWRAAEGGCWTWSSPQWRAYTGQSEEASRQLGWLDALHPDDRTRTMQAWQEAVGSGAFAVEYRVCHIEEGRHRWFSTRAAPVRDDTGRVVEWLGTSTDIDDLRQMQERQGVLVAELQHRTRNLMGVVRSMADKAVGRASDLADFRLRYGTRLAALARVQGLLSRLDEWDRVTFDELIASELAALGDGTDRITLGGPKGVALRSSTVQTFALALHELMTNALKYGALAQPDGRLAVAWRLERAEWDGRPWLHVDWRESGVTMPAADSPPRGSGSGRELIERALPYQLGARTRYVLGADGVHCAIALPISERQRIRETADA